MDNNKIIITFSGESEAGKDYISNMFKEQLEKNNKKVLKTHYADLLKYICKTFFNWDGKKDEHGRTLLQYIGTDVVRKQNPDYWVNFVNDIINMFQNEWDYVLIPDARFANEIEVLKNNKNYKVFTILVVRPDHKSILTEEQRNHPSEVSLKDYPFDYTIINKGNYTNVVGIIDHIEKRANDK